MPASRGRSPVMAKTLAKSSATAGSVTPICRRCWLGLTWGQPPAVRSADIGEIACWMLAPTAVRGSACWKRRQSPYGCSLGIKLIVPIAALRRIDERIDRRLRECRGSQSARADHCRRRQKRPTRESFSSDFLRHSSQPLNCRCLRDRRPFAIPARTQISINPSPRRITQSLCRRSHRLRAGARGYRTSIGEAPFAVHFR